MNAKNANVPGGTWGLPLVGLAGTVAGMLFAFSRIGTEPEWQTAVQGRRRQPHCDRDDPHSLAGSSESSLITTMD
jgi:hypothetical protein